MTNETHIDADAIQGTTGAVETVAPPPGALGPFWAFHTTHG